MRVQKSLRNKFVRTMLFVSSITGVAILGIVVMMSAQTSGEHLKAVQSHIQEGITSKGWVLTQNHARALRGLTLDNAFLDMQRLVERAVTEDRDVVYGVYVNSDRATLAYSDGSTSASADAAPAQDAWKKLGISEQEVLVKSELTRREQRLGREVLEVAVPVTDEEGTLLGTILYGLSTDRVHDALRSAQAESDARLRRSLLLIGSLVGIATTIGMLLSRIQAGRITKPLGQLTQAAKDLAGGNREVRVRIDSGDELELLGSSFNRMVEELDASYGQLEQMNRTLEHKVEERTAELARKNRDMRLVLDNVDQGFITLSADGTMARERSQVVSRWFGECEEPRKFWEYMGLASRSFGLEFQLGWEQLMEGFLPLELCLDQLPQRLNEGGRTWSLRYLPFHREGELEGVLVVIAEITEKLAREREEAEQQELMQGFKRLMLDRSGFASFLQDASSMVDAICNRRMEQDPVLLKRTLHTLKGNAALMGLTVVARICHGLEDQLIERETLTESALEELRSRWNIITEHVANFVGTRNVRVIEVPESEYSCLVSMLSENSRQTDVLHQLLSWQLEPVSRPFTRLGEQAKALARRLGKCEVDVTIQDNNVRIDPNEFAALFSELSHVIRNSVDHGFEPTTEREAAGKNPRGTLLLRAQQSSGQLTFEIADDGRGIDWAAIAEKAKQRGLPAQTSADLLAALCTDGITTKEVATDTSGRGVGMAALKQRIEALRGRLEVRSVRGVGTTWILQFPMAALPRPRGGDRGRHSSAPSAN